jgi:hypothetical protein
VKANRGNAFLLMVFYSMSAASVMGGIMSDHRLQASWDRHCSRGPVMRAVWGLGVRVCVVEGGGGQHLGV